MEVEEIGMKEREERRGNKGKKKKKKEEEGIKVVYISNPMMVNATESQFRALVQHLTGQHAELPPDLSAFHDGAAAMTTKSDISISTASQVVEVDPNNNGYNQGLQVERETSTHEAFQGFDPNVFTTDIMDTISAFVPPSLLFYHSDDLLTTLDAALL